MWCQWWWKNDTKNLKIQATSKANIFCAVQLTKYLLTQNNLCRQIYVWYNDVLNVCFFAKKQITNQATKSNKIFCLFDIIITTEISIFDWQKMPVIKIKLKKYNKEI